MRILFLSSFLLLTIVCHAQFQVGEWGVTFQDGSRDIDCEVFYPATSAGNNAPVASGEFPIIVFGHGFSMNYDAYENFWEELVPQGYIIVFPKTEVGPIPFPDHARFGQDLSFLVDLFLGFDGDNSSRFFQKIRPKVAVMGHSMGGGCSYLAVEQNANVSTIITYGAAETNTSAIAAAANITAPGLVFVGENDNVASPSGNSTDMYNALASDCKTYITINDGAHCRFANSNVACEFGETTVCLFCSFISRTQQHQITFRYLNPWLAFYLQNDCPKWDVFQNELNSATDISFQQSCSYQLPTASSTLSGLAEFCQGDSAQLIGAGGGGYLWNTGDTTTTITVKQSGTYFLQVIDEQECRDTAASQIITVNAPLQASIDANKTTFCEGDSIELILIGFGTASVLWSDGNTQLSRYVSQSDTLSALITDINGCVSTTAPFGVAKLQNPEPQLLYAIEPPLCDGDSMVIFVGDSFNSYEWSTGNTVNVISINSSTAFEVTVTSTNGCKATVSDSITFAENPAVSAINFNGGILQAPSGFMGYQWFLDGQIVSGADSSLIPTANGEYSVVVTNVAGCSALLSAVTVTGVGVEQLLKAGIRIYPNPATSIVHINTELENYQILLTDMQGKVLKMEKDRSGPIRIDVQGLAQGIHFLSILQNGELLGISKLSIGN